MRRIVVLSTAFFALAAIGFSAASAGPPPAQVPFTLVVRNAAGKQPSLEGVLQLSERGERWRPADDASFSFAKIRDLRGEWRSGDGQLRVTLTYECMGPEVPARRFCFETRALDEEERLLAHAWQVEGDNRIGPAEVQIGSIKGYRSRLNSTNSRLHGPALQHLARFEFRLTEFADGTPRHFPSAPHKLSLKVTRADECGRFDVTFTNRAGWDLEAAKHQIAFQLFVRDAEGKLVRADRRFLAYRDDGAYRQRVCVEPQYYEYSSVSVTVFTRQPDNDKFIRDFFFSGSSSYSGIWTGDAGRLTELPLQDGQVFKDLPEWSRLADLSPRGATAR